MQRVLVILNARAGALLTRDPADVKAQVIDVLHGAAEHIDVRLARGADITRAIAKGAKGDYDTIIVGGGDGSANCGVANLAHTNKTLGVLPFGTLNLLARDLGMPADIGEALEALKGATAHPIDLASLNGRVFHSISGLGFFTQMARAREEARNYLSNKLLRIGVSAIRAIARTQERTVTIDIDGKTHVTESYAVLVTCNRFGGTDWRRDQLDAGCLELHVATERGSFSRLKAGADLITGGWRDNPAIKSFSAQRVTIASNRRRASVATDGELLREQMPLHYRIVPRAVNVLVPRQSG